MGWASAGGIFEPVAGALIASGADGGVKRKVCSALIGTLLDGGWDTAEESLGLYRDHDSIVAAFGEHGIYSRCFTEHDEQGWVCEEREAHEGEHQDYDGHNWPQ